MIEIFGIRKVILVRFLAGIFCLSHAHDMLNVTSLQSKCCLFRNKFMVIEGGVNIRSGHSQTFVEGVSYLLYICYYILIFHSQC